LDILNRFPDILEAAQQQADHALPGDIRFEAVFDRHSGLEAQKANIEKGIIGAGRLILGDNLQVAKTLRAGMAAGTIPPANLVYLDPPFFTRSVLTGTVAVRDAEGGSHVIATESFADTWKDAEEGTAFEAYLTQTCACIMAARELLAEDGSLWLHLDHHAVHYVKVLADAIFGGPEHLMNEVIWQYKSGGATKRRFARKHDTLLFYAKDPRRCKFFLSKEKSYNRGRKPYRFKGVKEYRDDEGWYTWVNMKDVWQIDMVGRTSAERTGYATQKPYALLLRILNACTREGDLVVDLYGGSGTTAIAAAAYGRDYILCDNAPAAILTAESRMVASGLPFSVLCGHPLLGEEDIAAYLASAEIPEERKVRLRLIPHPPRTPEITVRFDVETEEVDAQRLLVRVRVSRYGIAPEDMPVKARDRALVEEAAAADPAQMIALLMAGPDEQPYRPLAAARRGEALEFFLPRSGGAQLQAIKIVAKDIFGNSCTELVTRG
jgi:DNA modification methylase